MSYLLELEEKPSYVHARVTGERTPENARRFLKEAYAACVTANRTALLLEVAFSGPSLHHAQIYGVVSAGSLDGARLARIAYVDGGMRAEFAETVAVNRGVEVRLFPDVEAATRWLSAG